MTITLTREEAQQVLDAIAAAKGYIYHNVLGDKENQYDKAIETLRARLSAPESEPYGYIARRNWKMPVFIEADNVEATGLPYDNADYEPVFKAPPQREWQGLTDAEMFDCLAQTDGEAKRLPLGFKWFAEAIEAKLKQKNA
jgi:hypothetical protein